MNILVQNFFRYSLLISVIFFSLGAYYTFYSSSDDYLQGSLVRIMYIHVPSAFMVSFSYLILALFSLGYIFTKKINLDYLAYATAKFAILVTMLTIMTGSIWGRPSWGTYWAFDARLTSVLINLFILASYFILRNSLGFYSSKKVAAIFVMFGLINQPIIKFSVYFWNTLHQKSSIFNPKGISIDSSMLIPLTIMFAAVVFFALWYVNICYSNVKIKQERLFAQIQ